MLTLTERGVDIFSKRYNSLKQESFWKNYDLVIWEKDPNAFFNIKGIFRNDAWGKAEVFTVNQKGNWVLPKKYVKYFK